MLWLITFSPTVVNLTLTFDRHSVLITERGNSLITNFELCFELDRIDCLQLWGDVEEMQEVSLKYNQRSQEFEKKFDYTDSVGSVGHKMIQMAKINWKISMHTTHEVLGIAGKHNSSREFSFVTHLHSLSFKHSITKRHSIDTWLMFSTCNLSALYK